MFSSIASAQTDGSVTYTIKTLPKAGSFSPRHVFAMWVTDNSNKLLKNLELSAADRKKYLYTWNSASGGTATDITTGATLSNHTTHTKTWNCRDKAGILVGDGTYKIRTEFTSEHAQGPLFDIPFTKAKGSITLNPAASTYFSNINLVFTPVFPTDVEQVSTADYELDVYPNPVKDKLNIEYSLESVASVNLSIYNMNMQLITSIHESKGLAGKNQYTWTIPSDLPAGSYVLVLQSDRFIATRKVIIAE
jgi:flagellar hook assembly protein FlgD